HRGYQYGEKTVGKGCCDRQRDEGHHARRAIADLRYGHLQKGEATVQEDDDGEGWPDQLAGREFRHLEAKPGLDHWAIQQHRNGQEQAPPEAPPEHLLVPGVIDVCPAMPGVAHCSHRLSMLRVLVGQWMRAQSMPLCGSSLRRLMMTVLIVVVFGVFHLRPPFPSESSSCCAASPVAAGRVYDLCGGSSG